MRVAIASPIAILPPVAVEDPVWTLAGLGAVSA
jgi:hypothetical protein